MRWIVLCLGLAGCTTQASANELIDAAQRHAATELDVAEVDAAERGTAMHPAPRKVVRATTTGREPPDLSTGPFKTTPRELFEDFTRPDGALLDKYRHGAMFTATIKTVGVDEDGAPIVWIDVDGENLITLDFAVPPRQSLRAGAQLTVTCKIGGASGALMMIVECTDS